MADDGAEEYRIREEQRVATASIRGYRYQLLHTTVAWLETPDQVTLLVEGNEDVDRLFYSNGSIDKVVEEQIKFRSEAIAQSDEAITKTLERYLLAFCYYHLRNVRFKGILRTNSQIRANAKSTLGAWICGKPNADEILTSIRQQAEREGNRRLLEAIFYIYRWKLSNTFVDSVEWAPESEDIEDLEKKIERLVSERAVGLHPGIGAAALGQHLLRVITKKSPQERLLRRFDADLLLNDCLLNTLAGSAAEINTKPLLVVLWSQPGPPSVAVALLIPNEGSMISATNEVMQNDALLGERRPTASVLEQLIPSLDFVAYGAIRSQSGPHGSRVCMKSVIRQTSYRHNMKNCLVAENVPAWLSDWLDNIEWPADKKPILTATTSASMSLVLAAVIAEALQTLDESLLRRIGGKMRWIYRVDDRQYFTAENPLVPELG